MRDGYVVPKTYRVVGPARHGGRVSDETLHKELSGACREAKSVDFDHGGYYSSSSRRWWREIEVVSRKHQRLKERTGPAVRARLPPLI